MENRTTNINPDQQVINKRAQYLQCIFGPMRGRFLILALVCVFLGVATAIRTHEAVNIWQVVLTLIGGVAAHGSVNALNEYCDIKSGLDMRTNRTPFSGGTGTLPRYPQFAWVTLATGLVTLGITAGIGLFFIILHGLSLLPIGLLGLIIIVAYTPRLTYRPLLCLIAPGLGFGPIMVVGTQIALIGHSTLEAWIVSLVPFFLVNNLLLLNQFPDVEADRSVGRNHVLVALGPERSSFIFAAFVAAAFLVIITGVLFKYLPLTALVGLATLFIAIPTIQGVFRYNTDIPHLIPSLIKNVLINLTTPVLLGVGLLLAR